MRRSAASAVLAFWVFVGAPLGLTPFAGWAGPLPEAAGQDALVLNDKAINAFQQGLYEEAEAEFKRALDRLEAGGWMEDPTAAQILDNLAYLYLVIGREEEAEQAYRRVIGILETLFGPTDSSLAPRLHILGNMLRSQDRYAEALPLLQRALSIRQAGQPASHPDIGETAFVLGQTHQALGDAAQAEAMFQNALEIWQSAFGPESPEIAALLNDLGHLYLTQSRYGEAEDILQRSLAANEASLGPDDAETGRSLNNLAALYQAQARYDEAEPLFQRAIAIWEQTLGPAHRLVGNAYNNLAQLHLSTGRYAEAERGFRKSLTIFETVFGKDHLLVGVSLGNLGFVLQQQGRRTEAEALMVRSLGLLEGALGPDHPDITASLTNLGLLYRQQGRFAEARPLLERALSIFERTIGPDHLSIAIALNNLADLSIAEKDYAPAEPLLLRALDIQRQRLGPGHPDIAATLNNIGALYYKIGRIEASEDYQRQALALFEDALGPVHPDLVLPLTNLRDFYRRTGRYVEALDLSTRALGILNARRSDGTGDRSERAETEFHQSRPRFRRHIDLLEEALAAGKIAAERLVEEGFRVAQNAVSGSVEQAMKRAATRVAAGGGKLAALVRDRQDLLDAWRRLDGDLLVALGRGDRSAASSLRDRLARLDTQIDAAEAHLGRAFPDYLELVRPGALTIHETQMLLAENEVLLLYILNDERLHLWVVRKSDAAHRSLPTDATSIARSIGLIRESLEPGPGGRIRPFPAAHAHNLHSVLIESVRDLLREDDSLLVVADGALEGLPFGLLLTKPPRAGRLSETTDLRSAPWLAKQFAVTVLPGVSSLHALRGGREKTIPGTYRDGSTPFIGIGDPLLDGKGGADRAATAAALFRGPDSRLANAAALRGLARLPETADELRRIAALLGAGEDALFLGAGATETAVKSVDLSRARIISFATHGVVAGSFEAVGQPGLVLTPPAVATQEDDGLLTAGEVALLRLNADTVILSACNTAAADGTLGAEGLSGLAKAFLYAGARSLLVSHWPVDSAATVTLMTRLVGARKSAPGIGTAEALRRARLSMIDQQGDPKLSHPYYWAPFVVVGEGAGR